jgi:hypothetical protein
VKARILVAVAAIVSGVLLGVLVVGMMGGDKVSRPPTYEPFLAGPRERITKSVTRDGPIFFPDPRGGDRAFYLDLVSGAIVALNVVPPGGGVGCPVQWDRKSKRYTDCKDNPVDPATLRHFPVINGTPSRPDSIYVDLRTLEAPPPS